MSDISEEKWTKALISVLEQLEDSQYNKMLELLEKIPQNLKTGKSKSREKMARRIIEHYGLEQSISAVSQATKDVPRNDERVQGLLRPFMEKLRQREEEEEEKQGTKRKREEEEEVKDVSPPQSQVLNQQSSPPDTVRNSRCWQKSICDVKSRKVLDADIIVGKVVKKSGLRRYQTKDKQKKFFFYVAIADETDSLKLMVYGKKHYQGLTEGSSYCFRNLKEDEYGVKFTSDSRKSQTKAVDVHEELHTQAQRLIYPESPVSSVENALSSADRTEMSVEGTVTMINPIEKVQVKHKQEKTKKQTFHLEDKTGSIKICMWGDATKHCKDLSPDDVIKVTNVKTNRYFDTVSLDSTRDTHIHKVHSVGILKVTMEIIGIVNANKKETHLDAHLESSPQLHTFVVASRLLAKAFDLKLDGDFKDSLLDKIPLPADAEIQGNKIKKITVAQEM